MKKTLQSITIFLIFISNNIFGQCNGRYNSEIFSSVKKETIYYSDVFLDNEHSMDVYTPIGDTITNRPLIIYLHGGTYYAGDKSDLNCIDFCESFAKRGYVTASLNYRLTNIISFLLSNDEQIKAVLRTVADSKAAVRFFRKQANNGNQFGIDPASIFIGGYSAGAVTAIHHAFIDTISDLPLNIQGLISEIGGTLEGDAGNLGYSSKVQGVVSIAGGIMDQNWIDVDDEPIVSTHGSNDNTIDINCNAVMNNPAILSLCGSNTIHNQANTVGLFNDILIFNGADHSWPISGNSNSNFTQSINFFSDFLYNLLPCNQIINSDLNQINSGSSKNLIKTVTIDLKNMSTKNNQIVLYFYNDGSVEKRIILE